MISFLSMVGLGEVWLDVTFYVYIVFFFLSSSGRFQMDPITSPVLILY
jgi:hypothetical protein